MATFRTSVQEVVDELGEVRRKCALPAHKALVTRLLFVLTRCSRLELSGAARAGPPLPPPLPLPPQRCTARAAGCVPGPDLACSLRCCVRRHTPGAGSCLCKVALGDAKLGTGMALAPMKCGLHACPATRLARQ